MNDQKTIFAVTRAIEVESFCYEKSNPADFDCEFAILKTKALPFIRVF
jgi:hypothetical protein